MAAARFSHLAINVSSLAASEAFYIKALAPIGIVATDGVPNRYRRLTNGDNLVIVLAQVEVQYNVRPYHRKGVGLHHLALVVDDRGELDRMERHLAGMGIPLLGVGHFETSYRDGYSSLMFEDPDRMAIEVACHSRSYFMSEGKDPSPHS